MKALYTEFYGKLCNNNLELNEFILMKKKKKKKIFIVFGKWFLSCKNIYVTYNGM